jgi:branched-chain amino acid transport system ATP-binding protein
MKRLLEIDRLSAWYGRAQALFDVSLSLDEGEVLAIVGSNGAGKSTLQKAVIGALETRGRIVFDGNPIEGWPMHRRARAGIGWVPEDRRVFGELTVRENLRVATASGRKGPWTEARLFELFPNLASIADRASAETSGGEQQMLSIARALMAQPRLLLLDEPSEGIAPILVDALAVAVLAMKQAGTSILLSEQNEAFTRAVADRQLRLETGSLSASNAAR